jgi:DNA-binding transcriptional regulator YhcF (GntR family)
MVEAPYLAIAGEIRRRIEAGELRPGDRVPSTRTLVREFGVAMATATKALQVLQQQGLVQARPGVGTVVGSPRTSLTQSRGPSRDLNRDEVVRIAIAIADAEGLAALSMRRVAADLGVSTMALYRYVGGKDALVLQMVDRAIGEFPLPAKAPTSWRAGIETAARLQWAAYRRHLWLASAVSLSRPQALPNLLPHTDAVLRALGPFGLDGSTALDTAITVFAYVRGIALAMEAEVRAEQDTGMTADEWADQHVGPIATMISLEDLAGFRAVFQPGFDFDYDLDRLLDFGLELLLDGLEKKLTRLR